MKKAIMFILPLYFFLGLVKVAKAEDVNRFVTIVNPVRISSYDKNAGESLKSEYAVVKKRSLPATWLFTYDALNNKDIIGVVRNMDKSQEFGIFLEVTPLFSRDAGVSYHNTGFWHHATSVFLSGYTQDERRRLIDKVFEKYKEVFGNYPKSVGSWWTDAYSLNYIREKYGVTVNLVCSDQYSTDGYQIWGQPWEVAYYPSKLYSSVPATDASSKIDVVNIQWVAKTFGK